MKQLTIVTLVVIVLVLAACVPLPASRATPTQGEAGLPNPASKYCVDRGGKLEIRNETAGQAGYCVFTDGSECDEWAYFRGQCAPGASRSSANMVNPASKFCTDQGYKWEARDESGGQVGYCVFPDGSECEEWAFYRGQCAPGSK
jgi:putative hemolysin